MRDVKKNSKQTEKALEVWLWMRHPAGEVMGPSEIRRVPVMTMRGVS